MKSETLPLKPEISTFLDGDDTTILDSIGLPSRCIAKQSLSKRPGVMFNDLISGDVLKSNILCHKGAINALNAPSND